MVREEICLLFCKILLLLKTTISNAQLLKAEAHLVGGTVNQESQRGFLRNTAQKKSRSSGVPGGSVH